MHILQGLVFANVCKNTSSNDSYGSSFTKLHLKKCFCLTFTYFFLYKELKKFALFRFFLEEFLDWKPCENYSILNSILEN